MVTVLALDPEGTELERFGFETLAEAQAFCDEKNAERLAEPRPWVAATMPYYVWSI